MDKDNKYTQIKGCLIQCTNSDTLCSGELKHSYEETHFGLV